MRIVFYKVAGDRHALEIVRETGASERVECETRSYFLHDLLHYAVEGEAGLEHGFWGNLAKGRTLADMNDRTGKSMAAEIPQLMVIEQIVGAMSSVLKGRSAAQLVTALHGYAAELGTTMPAWLTADFIARVQVRMRRLVGRWKATPFGGAMALEWPPSAANG